MKFKYLCAGVVLALLRSSVANVGGGQGGVLQSGDLSAFVPKNAHKIEMREEDLRIDLLTGSARVSVDYILHNPGTATAVKVGFPSESFGPAPSLGPDHKVPPPPSPISRFKAFVEGKPLDVVVVPEKQKELQPVDFNGPIPRSRISHWHTFELNFAARKSQTLRVEFEMPYSYSSLSVSDDAVGEEEKFAYSFSTAAVWKGPIQRGKVRIRAIGIPAGQAAINLAKRFVRKGNEWTWEFTDLEPTLADDLLIVAHPEYRSTPRALDGGFDGHPRVDFREAQGRWSMHHRMFEVRASSTRQPDGEKRYDAQILAGRGDGEAWVEGAKGHGLGESLELELKSPRKVSHIGIRNGYVATEGLYYANSRVAELDVSINGAAPFRVSIPDERLETDRRHFEIPLPASAPVVRAIKLTIAKVYPGTTFEDTAISSLKLVTPLAKAPKLKPSR